MHVVNCVFSSPSMLVEPCSEQGNRVRGISRQILRHVPMLNNACPLHPVNVRQRKRRLALLVDTHVGEANIIVETLTEDYEGHIGNDCQKKLQVSTFRAVWVSHRCSLGKMGLSKDYLLAASFSALAILPCASKGSCSVRLRAMYLSKAPMASFSM